MHNEGNCDLAICVLAAGAAIRFGGDKLDALLNEVPVGVHSLRTALSLNSPVFVICAPKRPAFVSPYLGTARVLTNPEPERGMGSSIKIGIEEAQKIGAGRLLITLADMPFIKKQSLLSLASFGGETSARASATQYPDGKLGVPACFKKEMFDDLLGIDDRWGGKQLLGQGDQLTTCQISESELFDIDRPADLTKGLHAKFADVPIAETVSR